MTPATDGPAAPGDRGPLAGIRVLELGGFIAAPMTGRLFAEFGAEVVKVERPRTGDELRSWRRAAGDTSLLFRTMGRGKRSVTLDLHTPEGREIALRLVAASDVVLENFRPGTLERLGLGPDVLRGVRPDVVLVRVSGYGQTGPYRGRPGFASVAESIGGLRHLTGDADRPPVRVGVSLGDTLAGLYGAIGALVALLRRERSAGDAGPETVDVALYEAVFGVLEDLVPEHDGYGVSRERTGAALPGIVPSNTYPTGDGSWVVIGGNGDAIYRRLMTAVGRPDLAGDPRLADNTGRVAHRGLIDAAITAWTAGQDLGTAVAVLEDAGVPVGPVYDAADILADPHFAERGMLVRHDVEVAPGDVRPVAFPGVVPRLEHCPGSTRGVGPDLGAHTAEVLAEVAGVGPADLARLRELGVV
ncbi:CaiB/BaiF CoA-transferase family protein [Geodermatophilus sp. DSM 44513]|uniref:CaiB/BaiF CoA transferase family protein n=1 Tax=Geodermatophilus sp. DSM 44513 TaxID=1528104 RepID=UPI00126F6A4D|nr:CaiB/BaiF CoA-transferase family protein [Geodermatophilus sp. DSM 44513]WNV74087.1 CaiB/BaiF CoA-transferase family protein [Geodermatophilus sp. DSM 44513]